MDNRIRNRNDFDQSGDDPVYSRLFVVYKRTLVKEVLEQAFSAFGTIEDIKIPLDHNGFSKGLCFIKFSKTSEAANALEAMDGRFLTGSDRRLKVLVAANRSEIEKSNEEEDYEKHKRLFLHVPKSMTENDLADVFGKFGVPKSVVIQRDHGTGESKGFAYVSYAKFSEAALAFEECERMYRPVFAKPKVQRRPMTSFESHIGALANSSVSNMAPIISMLGNQCRNERRIFTRVKFMCCPNLTHWQIGKLFDIIPGMDDCQFFVDKYRNCGKGTVLYNNPTSAAYAVQKLNEFEYPPGMILYVKPDDARPVDEKISYQGVPQAMAKLQHAIATSQSGSPDLAELAEAVAQASKLIKMATGNAADSIIPDSNDINYCSAELPPPQPLAHIDSPVAKRCFLICKPAPPPLTVLRDVFCRFGDLINVYTLPNKTVGYARYASVNSANEALKTLHGAEVCGVRMKVIEAEEEAPPKKRRFE